MTSTFSHSNSLQLHATVLHVSLQAFTLAPLFVWFELLFLLGYRPQLFAEMQKRVAAETSKLKKKAA
jgi:uncharacterized membrane protein YGL010W